MFITSVVVFQVIIFIVLILVLKRMMNKSFVSATKHLDDMNQDFTKKEAEINKKLQEIKQRSDQTISKAYSEGEKKREEIIKEAEELRERLLREARSQAEDIIQQADRSRDLLLSELDKRIEKKAREKACSLVVEVLPDDFKKEIHIKWVEDLIENGFSKLEQIKIERGLSKISIVSAFTLAKEERDKIEKRLEKIFKKKLPIDEKIDGSLIAGLMVIIGSLVIDGSLKNKIEEKTKAMSGKS